MRISDWSSDVCSSDLHVMRELNGQAKAMIVTQSREHALRYFFGVRDYIKSQGYKDLKALVAFSGELDFDGETYTEADLNGFSEIGRASCRERVCQYV